MRICAACAVERDEPLPAVCPICADERQYVPQSGQQWLALEDLVLAEVATELEPDLIGIETVPVCGIGQQAKLVVSDAGNLLWDPLGYVSADLAAWVRGYGPVVGIAASHPHMFGAQLEWSRLLGDAPVLVNAADAHWLGRRGPAIREWSGEFEVTADISLHQIGGHFPGACVARFTGRDGAGVVLAGDTAMVNPDRTVSFMRSYPNRIPLSAATVEKIAGRIDELGFDRLYNNFREVIPVDARGVVRRSADRHIAWVRGDFDHLT